MSKLREQVEKILFNGLVNGEELDITTDNIMNLLRPKIKESEEQNKMLKYGNEKRQKEINILRDKLKEAESLSKQYFVAMTLSESKLKEVVGDNGTSQSELLFRAYKEGFDSATEALIAANKVVQERNNTQEAINKT